MAEKPPAERDSLKDDAKRVGRQAGKSVGSWDYSRPKYPHNIHPVLVPGISLDEQRRRYSVDKIVFCVAGVLTVAFVIWGLVSPDNVGRVADAAYTWVTTNLSWLFSAVWLCGVYSVDIIVCCIAGVHTVAWVIWGLVSPDNASRVADAAYTWMTTNLSWLLSAVATKVQFSLLALAITRYGKIPLLK